AVLAELLDEARLLGRLVLRCVPVIDGPEDAHPAQGPCVIDVLDLFAHDLFGVERALLALASAKDLEVMVEGVVLRVLPGGSNKNVIRQAQDLAPHAIVRQLDLFTGGADELT